MCGVRSLSVGYVYFLCVESSPSIEKFASGHKAVPSIFADVDEDGEALDEKEMFQRFKK